MNALGQIFPGAAFGHHIARRQQVIRARRRVGLRGLSPRQRFGLRGLSPRRQLGLRGLGQAATSPTGTLTAAQALQQAIQVTNFANRNPRDFGDPTWQNLVYAQIQNGQFDVARVSPSCAGIVSQDPSVRDLSLTQAAGAAATMGTGITALLVPALTAPLGIATLGIGAVVAIVSVIFAHHAAAVKQEQQIECTVTTAANNAMSAIAEGVQNGQIAPADAAATLDQVFTNYAAMAAPSFGTHPYCNANCELEIVMKAMVLFWQSQYQAMAAQQAQSAATPVGAAESAVQSVAASTGLPSWLLWVLGAWLVYELI